MLIFVSWSLHPGNVAGSEPALLDAGAAILFEVTTFPVVTILPADVVNQFFWATIVGNALLWGLIAIWLHTVYRRPASRRKQSS
jgi:hypothetical protein